MKRYVLLVLFIIPLLFCQKNPQAVFVNDGVQIFVEPEIVVMGDTLQIRGINKFKNVVTVFVQCDTYLTLYYQKYENGAWGDMVEVNYAVRCASEPVAIASGNEFNFQLRTSFLDGFGTYRLLLPYLYGQDRQVRYAVSNQFEVYGAR